MWTVPTGIMRGAELTGTPKTVYELGEDFSKSGIGIRANFSNGDVDTFPGTMCQVQGYDKRKRGAHIVTLRVNGRDLAILNITVKIPASAVVSPIGIPYKYYPGDTTGYYPVYITGNLAHGNRGSNRRHTAGRQGCGVSRLYCQCGTPCLF
jgi:hypothetical protein